MIQLINAMDGITFRTGTRYLMEIPNGLRPAAAGQWLSIIKLKFYAYRQRSVDNMGKMNYTK